MNRFYVSLVALFVAAVLSVTQWLFSPWTFAQTPRRSIGIGAARVHVTEAHFDGGNALNAFIRTGSVSPNCLATFNENDPGFTGQELVGLVMMCRPRQPEGLGQGVLVSIFLPFFPPETFSFDITLWHEGALRYGEPVPCHEPCA